MENLFLAWREFRRGKRKRRDVLEFEFNLENNLFQLHSELKSQTYLHGNYTQFYVTDPKLRLISKADVKDRVLHQAVFRVLYPIFDKTFIHDSYSCRIAKGTHAAINRLEAFARKLSGNHSRDIYALKCDIKKFFDSADQKVLTELIGKKISDEKAVWLVGIIITSFPKGLPLGNVTSQLFANIYLNELDQFAKHILKERYYIRYCDDFVILGRNSECLLERAGIINVFLGQKLKLSLHPNKIIVRKYRQGIDFLGYVALPQHRVLRTKTKKRIFKRINIKNQASYFGVLGHCNGFNLQRKILRNRSFDVSF